MAFVRKSNARAQHNYKSYIMTTQCYKTILLFPIVEQISYSNFKNKICNVEIYLQPKCKYITLAFKYNTNQILK